MQRFCIHIWQSCTVDVEVDSECRIIKGVGNRPFLFGEGEKMGKMMNKVNLVGGGVVAMLSSVFGQFWFLFAGFLAFNVVDWLSGWYLARKKKEESSKIGAIGIMKKVWYWVVIGMAFFIGFAFEKMGAIIGVPLGFLNMIGWFVLASYTVNEIRSILENIVRCGTDVPKFFTRGLQITSDLIDKAADGKIDGGGKK